MLQIRINEEIEIRCPDCEISIVQCDCTDEYYEDFDYEINKYMEKDDD